MHVEMWNSNIISEGFQLGFLQGLVAGALPMSLYVLDKVIQNISDIIKNKGVTSAPKLRHTYRQLSFLPCMDPIG